MIWYLIFGLTFIFIILILKYGNIKQTQTIDIDVPNPENSNPKSVIDSYNSEIISQIYKQLKEKNKEIPSKLDSIFLTKINLGYIIKEEYLWNISIESIKKDSDNL
jgi:hypothetical protein